MTQHANEHAIVLSGQSPDDAALLTLKEIAQQIGADYEKLRTYADVPGVKDYLAARPLKGSRGVGYPPSAVPLFARILADAQAGRVQPKTLAAYLQTLRREPGPAAIVSSGQSALVPAIVPLSQLPADQAGLLLRYTQALEDHARALQALPPPDDCLLTLAQASRQFGVPLHALRPLRVKIGRRHKVRRTDVQRFIQSLQTT